MSNLNESQFATVAGLHDDPTIASNVRLAIVGEGSVGMTVTEQLVRLGIGIGPDGIYRLADGDILEDRNLAVIGRRSQVGLPKVTVATQIIQDQVPTANITTWNRRLTTDDIPQLVKWASASHCMGIFIDDFSILNQIFDACYRICPIVTGHCGERCDFAEVAFSIPGQTQPLSVTLGRRERQTITNRQALGCDIIYVASFVTALIQRLVAGQGKGSDLFPCYANAPLYLIGLRRAWNIFQSPSRHDSFGVLCWSTIGKSLFKEYPMRIREIPPSAVPEVQSSVTPIVPASAIRLPMLAPTAAKSQPGSKFLSTLTELAQKVAAIKPTEARPIEPRVEVPPAPKPVVHRRAQRFFD